MKKKKTKEMRLPTRFNPGTHKFEPVLPTLVKGKKVKFKDSWQWLWVILICIAIGVFFLDNLQKRIVIINQ